MIIEFEYQSVSFFSLTTIYEQISLPHKVNEDNGKAQFDKTKKVLIVTLQILRPEVLEIPPLKTTSLVEECSDGGDNSPDSGIDMSTFSKKKPSPTDTGVQTQQPQSESTTYDADALENATFETKNFYSKYFFLFFYTTV